jgi:PKD repeat protein
VAFSGTFTDVGELDTHTIGWDFDDGTTAADTLTPVHKFAAGAYTVTLTVTDDDGGTGSDQVIVTVERAFIFLPLVARNFVAAPDLAVERLIATSSDVQVVIVNVGNAPVTDEFWVDVFIDPNPVPTAVNQTWDQLASQGLLWGVTADALPALVPGGTITLTVDDAYYQPHPFSQISWPLLGGTPVYAQVDSYNAGTVHGAVMESHEIIGGAYNNIGSVISTLGTMGKFRHPVNGLQRPSFSGDLPGRPRD